MNLQLPEMLRTAKKPKLFAKAKQAMAAAVLSTFIF